MGEKVETGGLMSFDYALKSASRLSEEKKKEIAEAYEKYNERKRKERRNRAILRMSIVLTLILLAVGAYFLFK